MSRYLEKTKGIWIGSLLLSLIIVGLGMFLVIDFVTITEDFSDYNYAHILYLGGILFAVGLGLGLSTSADSERDYLDRLKIVWIVMILVGLIFLIMSILDMFEAGEWEKWASIGIPLLMIGMLIFLSVMDEDLKEKLRKLAPVYFLISLGAIIFGFAGLLGLYQMTGEGFAINGVDFDMLYVYACIPFALGVIPFAFTSSVASDDYHEKFDKIFVILGLLFTIIAVLAYLGALVEILGDMALLGYDADALGSREAGLFVALTFGGIGIPFWLMSISEEKAALLRKLTPLWFLFMLIGVVIYALNSLAPESFPNPTMGLGMMAIFFFMTLSFKGLNSGYESTVTSKRRMTGFAPAESFDAALDSASISSGVPSNANPEEATLFLTIQKKAIDNAHMQLQTAYKSGKCSEPFFVAMSKSYAGQIEKIDNTIKSLQMTKQRSARRSIFEEELGIKKAAETPEPATAPAPTAAAPAPTTSAPAPTPAPPGPPGVPPSPAGPPRPPGPPGAPPSPGSTTPKPPGPPSPPTGPPSPPGPPKPSAGPPSPPSGPPSPPGPPKPSAGPPSPPSGPPMPPKPPGGMSAPAPSPSGPPAPPGPPKPPGGMPAPAPAPGGMPPAPPGGAAPPRPPGGSSPAPGAPAPGSDVVGSARSTSIAELRGEMLKELRRLRDIFKEEGGEPPQ